MDQDKFSFAPLFGSQVGAALSVFVAVNRKPDPAAGWFVPLPCGQVRDASVFLGALCDASGNVQEWLEIWVQTVVRPSAKDAQYNNAFLDQKWRLRARALAEAGGGGVYGGPWQEEHPLPLYFSTKTWEPVCPCDPRGEEHAPWTLCQDDGLLKKAGLPEYSKSTSRYFYNPSLGPSSVFVAMDEAAQRNQRVVEANAEEGFADGLAPLNPKGGLLMIRKYAPLGLRQFKRVLEGHGWQGIGPGPQKLLPARIYEPFREDAYFQNNYGLVFSGRRGKAGRLLECFLLKLLLFQEAVAQVAAVVKEAGLPFLNLSADDFRLRLPDNSRRLPSFWNFELCLGRTSESAAIEVEGKGSRFFKPITGLPVSIYQPKQMSPFREGVGSVRLRHYRSESDDAILCEGTLADVQVRAISPSDLLWMELLVGGQRVPFHAKILSEQNLAATEVRFETLPRRMDTVLRDALNGVRGVELPGVPYRVQPSASSPSDLYSLAVIGLEILIDSEKVPLEVAKDECLSLAREMSLQKGEDLPGARLARALAIEPRFKDSLGPQNVCREAVDAQEAAACIPEDLWWRGFEILIRMFPGVDRAAWARDLGDVDSYALESCFQGPLRELDDLIERARGLLFLDWTSNEEARRILDKVAG